MNRLLSLPTIQLQTCNIKTLGAGKPQPGFRGVGSFRETHSKYPTGEVQRQSQKAFYEKEKTKELKVFYSKENWQCIWQEATPKAFSVGHTPLLTPWALPRHHQPFVNSSNYINEAMLPDFDNLNY